MIEADKNNLERIKEVEPLIHHITNNVVKNDVANVTLALGASPIMSENPKEVEEIAAVADGLVLNTGTIQPDVAEAMLLAGRAANRETIPVVLDPVGVGTTTYRKETILTLLDEIDFTAIKGNAGEIATLAGADWQTKGVDAGEGDAELINSAKKLAKAYNCVVGMSGPVDIITDGKITYLVRNGHEMMSRITGSGCMLSGAAGCFLSVSKENPLQALLQAHLTFAIAGEKAAEAPHVRGTGTFRSALIDELYLLTQEEMKKNMIMEEV